MVNSSGFGLILKLIRCAHPANYIEPVRKELVFEAGHFTCSPFFRTSPNNYGFCLLCLLSAQKNHIFERELAHLDFFLRFLDVFSAESGRLG